MNRIKKTFDKLIKENKKALGIFVTAGDPNFESSLKLISILLELQLVLILTLKW